MSGFRPELRRIPPTDLTDLTEHPHLAARIRREIRDSGPMPFARFMALALYDPEGGYYRSADARPGRGGDFITAPELHPIFGELTAVAVEDAWVALGRPDPFIIEEHGAGEGALALPMLSGLPATIRYHPVDVDERRVAVRVDSLVGEGVWVPESRENLAQYASETVVWPAPTMGRSVELVSPTR